MKIEFWPHRGAFEESKRAHKHFLSLPDALEYITERSQLLLGYPSFSFEDIYIKYYGFDTRLQNECFMLCIGKHGSEDYIKKYKHPLCYGYLYFDVFKNKNAASVTRFISPSTLRMFLVEKCDVSECNIELVGEYCHFINKKEQN